VAAPGTDTGVGEEAPLQLQAQAGLPDPAVPVERQQVPPGCADVEDGVRVVRLNRRRSPTFRVKASTSVRPVGEDPLRRHPLPAQAPGSDLVAYPHPVALPAVE
jgi:hypothetical protein